MSALLQIIASDAVELYVSERVILHHWPTLIIVFLVNLSPSSTRQTCAVYLKNKVITSYAPTRPDVVPIPASDRDNLKSSILRLLAASPSRGITLPLASTLKVVVSKDVPNNNWPGLLDSVKVFLHSGDIREIHAGCVAALEVVRAFR